MNVATGLAPAQMPESIERLREMPAFLEAALDAVPRDEFLSRPAPGEFSLVEQACHLRDLEREGYLVRVRRILSETLPTLENFDGAAVAAARNYMTQDAHIAAQEFAAARGEVLGLLAATTPDDLDRNAVFDEKRITLRDLVAMMEAHDRGHREEIATLIEALEDL
jgi:hypothetical protein